MTPKPKPFYGWIIVFLAFLSITTYGAFYSFSVFLELLEAELHTTRTAISATYTIWMAAYCIFAIPMGWLSDKYGPRKTLWLAAFFIGCGITLSSFVTSIWQLYLLFGIVAGMGHGAIFVVPASTLNRWFIQRRGLAVGIAACGLGFGLLIVPAITTQVISIYGWREAFVFLGVTFFVVNVIVGVFIRGRPEDKGLRPLGDEPSTPEYSSFNTENFSVAEAVKTKAFWLLYLVCVFAFAAEQMVLVHIVPYGGAIGISPTQASLGLSSLGVGTIIGRVGTGALSDRIGRIPTLVMCCCIEAVAIFCLLVVSSPLTLYLTMLFLGFGYGGWVVLLAVMLGDFFGLKNLGAIMGVYLTSGMPAGILGPLMGGIVFDFTKSYFLAIVIAGIVCVGAIVLAALIKRPQEPPRLEPVRIE